MLCKAVRGVLPRLSPGVRAAENAALIGDVACGEKVNIWYGATLRGDMAPITVGRDTNLQDGAVLHCDRGLPLTVGEGCVVGHGAILHSCTVGDGTMVGMGAVLLSGCSVGAHCIVGAGALVTGKTVAPPYSLLLGSPARVVGTVSPEQAEHIRENVEAYLAEAEAQLPAAELPPKRDV